VDFLLFFLTIKSQIITVLEMLCQMDTEIVAKELTCATQNYAWGKKGESSLVAQLSFSGGHIDRIQPETTYAEVQIFFL
jgi:hypothetical protein